MVILGLISLLSFVFLIVGLVDPSKVLKGFEKPTRLKVFLCWIVLFTIIGIISSIIDDDKVSSPKVTEVINKETQSDPIDTLSEEEKTIQQLKNEIKSINKGIDNSSYGESVETLQIELVLFAAYAELVTKNINSENTEAASLAKELKSKVEKLQIKEFPIIRKKYTEIVANKMWEHDVYIENVGTGNKIINITAGIFAANKNIKDFQEKIHSITKQFRFHQTRYRWYKGADEYTSYTIYEGKDSDLVILD